MKLTRLTVTLAITLLVACGDSPTAPSPPPAVSTPPTVVVVAPPPVVARVSVAGVATDVVTGRALGGAIARIGTQTSSTDGNGYYSIGGVTVGSVTLSLTAPNYNTVTETFSVTGDTRRDVRVTPFWTRSGFGNTVFDMPSHVSRVRIQGAWTRQGQSNFIVLRAGRLVVNEILRESLTYDGTHLVTGGGTIEIQSSAQINWTFTQVQ